MKHILLVFAWSLVLPLFSMAQPIVEKRIDIEQPNYCFNNKVVPINESTALGSYEKHLVAGKTIEYNFDVYDTSLAVIWSKKTTYDFGLSESELRCNSKKSVHVFKYNFDGKYALISLDLEKNTLKKVTGEFSKGDNFGEITVLGQQVFLVGIVNGERAIVSLDWQTNKRKVYAIEIEGIKNNKLNYINSERVENTNSIVFYYNVVVNKKTMDVFAFQINENGELGTPINLSANINTLVYTANTQAIGETNEIRTGTFANEFTFQEGLFFSKSPMDNGITPEYFPLKTLTNFNSIANEQFEIMRKTEKFFGVPINKAEDLSLVQLPTRKLADGYLLSSEVYYWTTVSNRQLSANGNIKMGFGGFKYTMAVAIKLDLNGKMVWNSCFPMPIDEKSYSANWRFPIPVIETHLRINENTSKTINIAYLNSFKMVCRTYATNGNFIQESELDLGYKNILPKDQELLGSGLNYWYNDTYLAYGSVHSKEKTKRGEDDRPNQIFITKVKLP
jgi:hypothetical protein